MDNIRDATLAKFYQTQSDSWSRIYPAQEEKVFALQEKINQLIKEFEIENNFKILSLMSGDHLKNNRLITLVPQSKVEYCYAVELLAQFQ